MKKPITITVPVELNWGELLNLIFIMDNNKERIYLATYVKFKEAFDKLNNNLNKRNKK